MGLAKEMWDYLKSIGFEDIPNDDYRLGAHADSWKNTIGYGNLCAYNDSMDDFIGFVDTTKKFNQNNPDLKIRSVADLEAWLRKEYPEFFTVEQHQYKVGDKVRILEDATNDNGDSVLEIYERTKTAVGEIGVVQKVHGDGLILVRGQCGGWWSYEPHQIEPYIEEFSMESSNEVEHHYIGIIPEKVTNKERSNDSIESTTSEDALVINKDITPDNFHKVWEYNNGTKQWGNGFVTTISEEGIWAASIYNGDYLYTSDFYGDYLPFILRRVPLKPLPKEVANRESDTIVATQSITSEDAPTQAAINKDNIEAVLEYNGCFGYSVRNKYITLRRGAFEKPITISFNHPNWLAILEAAFGKTLEEVPEAEEIVLKVGDVIQFNDGLSDCEIKSLDYVNNKINYVRFADITRFADINNGHIKSVNGKQGKFVIPPFDFKQTLLDDGFIQVITENYIRNNKGLEILIKEDETRFHFWGLRDFNYECSPANAKRIINAAAELNELELA